MNEHTFTSCGSVVVVEFHRKSLKLSEVLTLCTLSLSRPAVVGGNGKQQTPKINPPFQEIVQTNEGKVNGGTGANRCCSNQDTSEKLFLLSN